MGRTHPRRLHVPVPRFLLGVGDGDVEDVIVDVDEGMAGWWRWWMAREWREQGRTHQCCLPSAGSPLDLGTAW
jgi:hypothetical protein